MEKKHTRNFSLDVHPYMLTIRKPKVEAASTEPLPSEHNMDTVYLEDTHTIVHVSGAITGKSNTIYDTSTKTSRTKRFYMITDKQDVNALACIFLYSSETKVCSPTDAAFSTMTLPTTTYINGVSPNPPSSEDALSPKSSTPPRDLLAQAQNPECQPPPLTIAPTHQLLSIHHTLFEEEEDEENRRDDLAQRPGELIAAGEC